jgi:hypothetical protein
MAEHEAAVKMIKAMTTRWRRVIVDGGQRRASVVPKSLEPFRTCPTQKNILLTWLNADGAEGVCFHIKKLVRWCAPSRVIELIEKEKN